MTRFKITIEREDGAPIVAVISEFHVTPVKPPRGRPKATAKHAAVVMAFQLELKLGNKPFKAGQAVAAQFRYSDEGKVRRIVNGKENPLRGANGVWFIQTGVDGEGALVIVTDDPDALVVTGTTIRVDGPGWIWRPGMTEAVYGKLRGGGVLTA
jgi:hypothetical protein